MTDMIIKIVLAYLLGSVSGSLLIGKLRNVDIRAQGSGNAGGTNAFRTQGLVFALGVVIIDVGKGFLAAWLIPGLRFVDSTGWLDPATMVMACGLAGVVGHCFPLWHGFRGGKGAATAVGAMIVIEPWLLLPLLITWLVTLIMTGYVGLSTVLAGFSLVPASWAMNNNAMLVFSSVLALFLLFTHRENIQRLLNGTENRFERIHIFSRNE